MSADHVNQILACAAILIAGLVLRLSPSYVRAAFFIVIFGTGLLAAMATLADSAASAAVMSLFG
ncbi:MAG: hypothetical protein JO032_01230 [Alphaproteobacteria bacterium]|nr:hypothetical protein [Alphaproteobacteria bacterium]MBV9551389.1 hypothetical protein [Alphaproteobacteria bacterium]